ncbi:hypothetical protein AMAG_18989 [Allomyces macrogynus ATCC 38327]|uniref:RING-type domain-containing protein n=1 Tax=Allomyces macrogynus (strain ATCC 38327) TaxID=578462 RepID=A0A0L0SL98_ALLM3|nr:hypothetical protein AMAG_18989 [Allomyces macrogynus ATCC 38327]|eukprot:KNE63336.1 hypothetical protein AMAG_18989 [Allomyces macrogynus ATCC 38327]
MEDDDLLCPLCCEEIDAVDKYFFPCPCGYQICRFCWNHIREDLNQLCPACRRPFDDESAVFNPVPPDELLRLNADRKRRARARQQRYAIDDRSHLKDTKVTQRTLVYVTGLPAKYANEELLKSDNYFGQFGRIVKLNVTRRPPQTVGGKTGENQIAVHITYSAAHEAIRAIQYVDGSLLEGRMLHATFGATKYCAAWLQGRQCTTAICNFLHEVIDNVAANAIVSPRGLPGTRYFGPKGRKQAAAAAAAAEADRDDDNASTASGSSSTAITRSGSMSSVSAAPTVTASASAASSGPALPATASWASKKPESRSTTPNSVRSTSPVTQPPKRTPSTSSTTSKRSTAGTAPIDAFPPPSATAPIPTPTRAKKDPAKKQAAREAREQRERDLLEKQERERLAAIREAKARAMAIAEAEAAERARVEAEARAAAEAKAKAEAEAKARAEAAERAARAAEEEARLKLAQAKAAEEAAARAKADAEERARREEEARLVEEARLRELAKPKPLDLGPYIFSAVRVVPVPLVEWAPSEATIQALADGAVQHAAARSAEWMLASSRVVLRAMDASRAPPPTVYGGSFTPLDTGDLLTDILEEKTALASVPTPAPNVSGSSTPINAAAALLSRQNSLVALLNGNGPAYVQPLGTAAAPAAPAAALPLGGLLAPLRRSISEAGSASGTLFRPQTPPQHVPPHAAQQPGQQPPPFGMPPFHMHQQQQAQQQQAVPSPGPAGFPPGPPPGQNVLFQDPAMLAMRMDFPPHARSPVPPAPHAPHTHAPPPPPPVYFSPHPAAAFTPPSTAPRGVSSPMGSSTGTLPSLAAPMPPAPLRATSLFQKLHDASLAGSQASSTPSSPAGPPPGFAGKPPAVAGPPAGIVARVASPVPAAVPVQEAMDTPTPPARVRVVPDPQLQQFQQQMAAPARAASPTPSAPRSRAASQRVMSPVETKKGPAEVPAAKKSSVETRKSPVGTRKDQEGKKDAKPAVVVAKNEQPVAKNEPVMVEPVVKNEVETKSSTADKPADAPAPTVTTIKNQEKSPARTPTPAPVATAEPPKDTPAAKHKSPSPAPTPAPEPAPRTPSPPPERKVTLNGVELTTTLFYGPESDTEDDDTASAASSAASVPMSPDLAAASDPPVDVSAAVAALAQVDLAQLAAALDAWVRDPSLAVPAGNATGNGTGGKKSAGGAGKKASTTAPTAPAVSVSPASAAAIATPSKAQRQWMLAVTANITSFFDAGVAALFGAPIKPALAAPADPVSAKVEDEDKGHAALTALLQQLAAEVAQVELASEEDLVEMEQQIKAAKKEVQQWDLRVKQVVKKNRKAGLV